MIRVHGKQFIDMAKSILLHGITLARGRWSSNWCPADAAGSAMTDRGKGEAYQKRHDEFLAKLPLPRAARVSVACPNAM